MTTNPTDQRERERMLQRGIDHSLHDRILALQGKVDLEKLLTAITKWGPVALEVAELLFGTPSPSPRDD